MREMAQRRINNPTKPRASRVTKNAIVSSSISNVGQLINRLQTYSPDEPLETVNRDLLRAMLRTLRTILEKPRSERNIAKIRGIDGCYLDNEILRQFPSWGRDPSTFWDSPVQTFPTYSGLAGTNERLRAFFSGALVMGVELKLRRIQWRFVTIVAHRHFTRRHQVTKVQPDKVRDFLAELGLEASSTNISRCHDVITSGKRRTEFCQKLQAVSVEQSRTDREENQHPVNYGPMFMSSIPDDIWDNKDGLSGRTADECFAHLLSLEAGTWITSVGCESLAKRLIAFHDHLIWHDATTNSMEGRQLTTNQYLPSNSPGGTSPPQHTPSPGRVVEGPNSPWQHLLSAAESAKAQAQPPHGGYQPDHGVDGFPLAATNQRNGSQANVMTAANYGALSKSGFTQPAMQLPPLISFDNPESRRGHGGRMVGTTSLLSASSHAEETRPDIPENFAHVTSNEALTLDDMLVLWPNFAAGAFTQGPSSYPLHDQNLLPSCGDAQLQW